MQIGEFARLAGVSTSKIRFYEAGGLLPAPVRSANGYRRYDAAELRVVQFIDRARELGFSLSDIRRFMSRPAEKRRAKTGVVEVLEAKLAEADRHLAEVGERRRQIITLLTELRDAARD